MKRCRSGNIVSNACIPAIAIRHQHGRQDDASRCAAGNRRRSCSRRRRSSTMPSSAALTQPQARDRERDADMAVGAETAESAPAADVGEPGERRQHRRARVLVRERDRRQHLLQRMPGNAERDRRERAGNGRGVACAERATLEQSRDDRPGQQREPDRGRQRKARARSRRRAIAPRRRRRGRRRAHGRRSPASSPTRWRSTRRRAAVRRAGRRRRATTPPPATTTPRSCRRSA